MTELMWIKSHVERLLQDVWDVCRVTVDDDGDYPFRNGTASCWVRVIEADSGPMVQVFSHAVLGVKESAKLLHELNEIQSRCLSASVVLQRGTVVVLQTISPIGLTGPVLHQALASVASLADDTGVLVA